MKDNVIPVLITKEDLMDGDYHNPWGCPLFKALKRLGYPVQSCGGTEVSIWEKYDYVIFEDCNPETAVIYKAALKQEPALVHLLKL